MKLINQVKKGQLTIKTDSLLSVLCFWVKNTKGYINALNEVNNIIISEFIEVGYSNFDDIDVTIERQQIIEAFLELERV